MPQLGNSNLKKENTLNTTGLGEFGGQEGEVG